VPLSSPPWTLPATQRMAGVVLARCSASLAGVRGSRSRAVCSRIRARPAGVTLLALPTMA
jgi:hypothetical protein